MQDWDAALEDLNRLKDVIESNVSDPTFKLESPGGGICIFYSSVDLCHCCLVSEK